MQCATSNHAVRHVWRMRHRLANPALDQQKLCTILSSLLDASLHLPHNEYCISDPLPDLNPYCISYKLSFSLINPNTAKELDLVPPLQNTAFVYINYIHKYNLYPIIKTTHSYKITFIKSETKIVSAIRTISNAALE